MLHIEAIMAEQGITDDDIKAIDNELKTVVNESADFAQQSPEPDPEELWTDVLIEVEG